MIYNYEEYCEAFYSHNIILCKKAGNYLLNKVLKAYSLNKSFVRETNKLLKKLNNLNEFDYKFLDKVRLHLYVYLTV